jgi:hypothetical protein
MNNYADSIRIRYFNQVSGSVYDDDITLTQSGNDYWLSGTVQSLDTTQGSTDSNLLEQGKIISTDSKIFVNGSVIFTDHSNMLKIQIGSPTGDQFSLIPIGAVNKQVQGIPIFKTAYVRKITGTGSLIGE